MSTYYSILLSVIAGWFLGILINYFADTLPVKRKLSKPFCMKCGAPMRSLNYLIYPRRCLNCGYRCAWRKWATEILCILVSLWLWNNSPEDLGYWIGIILFGYFALVTIIDLERRLILHVTSIAGLALGALVGVHLHGLESTIIGGTAGFLMMLALYFSGFLFVRISQKLRGQAVETEEALGFGDVNLSGIIGLVLGWPGIILGLVIAILLAGACSLIYIIVMVARRKYHPNLSLPYGPFLTISTIALLFFQDVLLLR